MPASADPIVAPPWKPELDDWNSFEDFDEVDRASSAAFLALLLTGLVGTGLVFTVLAFDVARRPWGLPTIHVDAVILGAALFAIYLGIYAVPKWGSEWAQPIVPESAPPSDTEKST